MNKKLQPEIVFENEEFVVLNKPAGLLSIPDRMGKEMSLKTLLQERYDQVFTVHRLDRDTSGLIVFAKDESTHKLLSQQFEDRSTQKIYAGFVLGNVSPASGQIDAAIAEHPGKKGMMMVHKKGKPSFTEYKVLEDFGAYSWTQFKILTGRTHQIRVHMQSIGHPIACDPLYGDGKPVYISAIKKNYKLSKSLDEETPMLNRLALHAWKLEFSDASGDVHSFEAPLPKDIKALLQQLRKWKRG
ncbi:MAG TPA: RluA family pseudouridine synthase [Chitinophagaceae bacterium]|nr:RluA family pseudouridine synthase [Chitinophagaceae bacterium]